MGFGVRGILVGWSKDRVVQFHTNAALQLGTCSIAIMTESEGEREREREREGERERERESERSCACVCR